jgi:putative ubiquitin-RnfH superfamily antitoxin RatB of RatAB toxin-antitoxin module
MRVEVVYARERRQDLVRLELHEGATASDAVRASGLIERHALAPFPSLAIAGRRVTPQQPLADGDRVEILCPLAADPVEARRRRARPRR